MLVKSEERNNYESVDFDVNRFAQRHKNMIGEEDDQVQDENENQDLVNEQVNGEDYQNGSDDAVLAYTSSGRKRRTPQRLNL